MRPKAERDIMIKKTTKALATLVFAPALPELTTPVLARRDIQSYDKIFHLLKSGTTETASALRRDLLPRDAREEQRYPLLTHD
jgi:hypothetical protein